MAHIPVLFDEVLALLAPQPGGRFIDGTLGAGGHTGALLKATEPAGSVLAFDRDANAIAFARAQVGELAERLVTVHDSYAAMGQHALEHGFTQVDGVLLDLGLSSRQLDDGERGFAFRLDGPLDMRFDQTQGVTAADLVNTLSATELADLFWQYGEERESRRLARLIVANRPVATTADLANLIANHSRKRRQRIHPATRIFQALRIAVNDELGALATGLTAAIELLKPGGRVAVISFHSLEDRYVKRLFRDLSSTCICPPQQPVCTCGNPATLKRITRKVVMPSADEIERNPRSRSAKLRVAEKLG